MKKLSMVLLSMLLLFVFAGCSADNEKNTATEKETPSTKTTKDTAETVSNEPIEPTDKDLCYFCNMKIYKKDEDMGFSTAQAIKQDGTHVFFDDAGCMLNASRKYKEEFTKKWVRDYQTLDWVEADKATIVKANVTTPMKYGYLFFANEEGANKFIKENPKTNGVISDWTAIDTEAAKRYKMKMQKEANMKSGDMKDNMESMKENDTMKEPSASDGSFIVSIKETLSV